MKRTNWISVAIKPIHIGWYEVKSGDKHGLIPNGSRNELKGVPIVMRYWNGTHWQWDHFALGRTSAAVSAHEGDKWRGLRAPADELMDLLGDRDVPL